MTEQTALLPDIAAEVIAALSVSDKGVCYRGALLASWHRKHPLMPKLAVEAIIRHGAANAYEVARLHREWIGKDG